MSAASEFAAPQLEPEATAGRPFPPAGYLERPRLTRLLPARLGHVGWLHAPYGYGKTVLLSQWAESLRHQGWRVVWLDSRTQPRLRPALAQALGLAQRAPWDFVLRALRDHPTLLALDEADGFDESLPLEHVPAVVGLASRRALPWPALPKLQLQGRLVVLRAQQLAFTQAEALRLVGDARRAEEAWRATRGWPLALHLSSLTGEHTVEAALVAGIRQSLGAKAWRAALFLASLPQLPQELADEHVKALADAGFATELEGGGYRLHDLVAEALRRAAGKAVRRVVQSRAQELPAWLRGEAYLRTGMLSNLDSLLDRPESVDLAYQQPDAVLRWDELLGPPAGPWRRLTVALALCHIGRLAEGLAALETLASAVASTHPEVALKALGNVAYHGASVDLRRALAAAERGKALLKRVSPEHAARFYNRVAWAYTVAGDHQTAKECLDRAMSLLPPGDPLVIYPLRLNRAVIGFELEGDLEELTRRYRESVDLARRYRPSNVPLSYFDLGRCLWLLGQREEAIDCFRRAAESRSVNFWAGTLAAAWHAYATRNLDAFPGLLSLSESSQDPALLDSVRGLWARTLRESGRARGALDVLGRNPGFWASVERALAFAALGWRQRAKTALPPAPAMREERLYWHAARYRVLRRRADLQAIVRLTTAGARVLPALIPLDELPPDPDLARWYPIEEVVRSGRRTLILARLDEVPPLEIRLLGCFEVRHAGQLLRLPETLRALLTLLAMRLDRESVCEALWPDSSPAKVRNRLNVHLHHLRRLLEPWRAPTFLGPEGLRRARVDLWELQEALEREDAAAVLALYREPFAPGVDLPAVDDFRWQLRSRVVSLLRRAARRDPERAATYSERLEELTSC